MVLDACPILDHHRIVADALHVGQFDGLRWAGQEPASHLEGLDTVVCRVEEDGIDGAGFVATLDHDHRKVLQIAGIHHGLRTRGGYVMLRNALSVIQSRVVRMGISSANEPGQVGLPGDCQGLGTLAVADVVKDDLDIRNEDVSKLPR